MLDIGLQEKTSIEAIRHKLDRAETMTLHDEGSYCFLDISVACQMTDW